jgi:Lon protease-like protein
MATGETARHFPLFPLGIVALPSELVPLHIFEERYKTMIGECLESGREFGIVWLSDEGLRPIGCACEITEVLEQLDDGRMNIVTRGTRPFRLVERQEDLAYPAGEVEFLPDRPEDTDPSAAREARGAYAELVERATDRRPDEQELAEMGAYEMAATVEFGLEAKQGLLDLRSENARLRLITRLFRAAAKRLDFVERAQDRARSNGKVRFGGATGVGVSTHVRVRARAGPERVLEWPPATTMPRRRRSAARRSRSTARARGGSSCASATRSAPAPIVISPTRCARRSAWASRTPWCWRPRCARTPATASAAGGRRRSRGRAPGA